MIKYMQACAPVAEGGPLLLDAGVDIDDVPPGMNSDKYVVCVHTYQFHSCAHLLGTSAQCMHAYIHTCIHACMNYIDII